MTAVILDVDGTLVDTNYHHAVAWFRAFRAHDITVPVWRIHRAIGMGGDKLVAALAGDKVEAEKGEAIRDAEAPLYKEMIDEVVAFEDARRLLEVLSERETEVVLSSSAKADEVDHYLDLLDARGLISAWTTSADVDETKPEPDLVATALGKVEDADAVMVGDSIWDVEAAKRAGIETVAVLTGGYARAELEAAGAAQIVETVSELADNPEMLDNASSPR